MAKEHVLKVAGHPSIYAPAQPREFTLYFCEPENGVTSETGLLLLIPGFGANAQSKIYKKMRSLFADKYNLVTIQCDYFGWEFMQNSLVGKISLNLEQLKTIIPPEQISQVITSDSINLQNLLELGSQHNTTIDITCIPPETPTNFNDMGLMQALDNLAAIGYVMAILEDNKCTFNTGKIIVYGHSQGAYLSYLCNALAPNLFTLLIDNSAWIFPLYSKALRTLTMISGQLQVNIYYDYLARRINNFDQDILHLPNLYTQFSNSTQILSYHGVDDELISFKQKQAFCSHINNCLLIPIGKSAVDNIKFKSTKHGLGADFLELFEDAIQKFSVGNLTLNRNPIEQTELHYISAKHQYQVTYDQGIPILERDLR